MGHVGIIVAVEPRCYREALAAALQVRRPNAEITDVPPADLDAVLRATPAALAIVSGWPACPQRYDGDWLLLYPDGAPQAILGTADGAKQRIEPIHLFDILTLIDQRTAAISVLHAD